MAIRYQYQVKSAEGSTSYKDFMSGAASDVGFDESTEDTNIINLAKKLQAISTGRLTGKFKKVVTTEFEAPEGTYDTIPTAVSDLTIDDVANLSGFVNIENEEGKSYDLKYPTMALGTSAALTANYNAYGTDLASRTSYSYIETGATGKYKKTLARE